MMDNAKNKKKSPTEEENVRPDPGIPTQASEEFIDEDLKNLTKKTLVRSVNENTLDMNRSAIRSSLDELVVMQRLSNIISTAERYEEIMSTLMDLTSKVIPVIECDIFLFEENQNNLQSISSKEDNKLELVAHAQLEEGIIDWVLSEKKVVVIPNLDALMADGTHRNYVIVPLLLSNRPMGVFIIDTEKRQEEFSNQDLQLLSVLATQAAAGVENYRKHKRLEKVNGELRASQAQMLQAAKLAAIGELAANILHEIKNPVQIMSMYIDMVQRGKPLPNWVDLIAQQTKRLFEITKRLMNFARAGSEQQMNQIVNLNQVVQEVVAIVQHEFKNDRVLIELALAENLPTFEGNGNALSQVYLNLLINSRDAMMGKGGTIHIQTEAQGMNVVSNFSDTGSGIPPETLVKIFEPFFTTKESGKGTGLGLSICRKIVSDHHGQLTAQSEVGKGTTFKIVLPVRRSLG
jgi:signal transduction histidine kinase